MPAKFKLAFAVAILALPVAWVIERQDRAALQSRLSAVATEIAERPVGVRCPGWWGRLLSPADTNAGAVQVDADGRVADHTELRKVTCAELEAVLEGGREEQLACAARSTSCGDDVQRTAWAVNTLAHEAIHLRGILDEGITECYAVQHVALAAQRLGATPAQARNLALLHWETGVPQLPEQYRAQDCGDGAPLDLRPDDPVWP
jgi:hypothetical protein